MECKPVVLILLLFTTLVSGSFAKTNSDGSNYLHKPTGTYGVGYKEYYLVNKNACPNVYFKESNKGSFSAGNSSYCNEIELAVYYPTKQTGTSPYRPISLIIADIKSFSNDISESDLEQVRNIKSYSGKNLPIADKQFPVIFFSPGYGVPAQEYENIISELVSHGYIIVGVNSQFISGNMSFNGSKVSEIVTQDNEEDRMNLFRNSYKDLAYAYETLSQQRLQDSVLKKINWNKVALLGHSLGSVAVARFATHPGILAVGALDLTLDLIDGNNCHPDVKVPFIHIYSSQLYQRNEKHEFPYLCKDNASSAYKQVYVIGGDDPSYSMHMNFCDYSTLQYAPPILKAITELNKKPDEVFLGTGNGVEITNVMNQKLLEFFGKYVPD